MNQWLTRGKWSFDLPPPLLPIHPVWVSESHGVPRHQGKNTEWSSGCDSLEVPFSTKRPRAMEIIYVKCSNYQVVWKCDRWQIKWESPAHPPTCWAKVHPPSPPPGKHKLVNITGNRQAQRLKMNFEEAKTVKSYFSCSVSVSGWFWRRSRFFLPLAQAVGNVI